MNKTNPANNRSLSLKRTTAKLDRPVPFALALLLPLFLAAPSPAQTIRFKQPQVRVTVPLNSSLSTVITNQVTFTGVTNANLNVSGVPAGATVNLSASTFTASGPLSMTVNTTNVAEGVYTMSLNADALDTNGLPVTNHIF